MARILIIDDALEFGRFLRTALLTMEPGLHVSVVPSAEEALLEITRQKPHLLVVDFRLPGMSGADLVRKVKARLPRIKMILVSGMAELELPVIAAEVGAAAYFRKPMVISEFLETVQTLLADIPGEDGAARVKPAAVEAQHEPAALAPVRLTDVLTGLRQRLGALCVLVVDERGKIIAQTGEFSDPDFERNWAPAVISALAAQMPLGRMLNPAAPEVLIVQQGKNFHLLATAAGPFACVMTLPVGRNSLRLAIAVEELLASRAECVASLEGVSGAAAAQVAQEAPVPTVEQILAVEELVEEPSTAAMQDFEALFAAETPAAQNADDFWESTTSATTGTDAAGPEMLSYEDARRLGLAPGEGESGA